MTLTDLLIDGATFLIPTDTFAGRLVPRDRPAKAPEHRTSTTNKEN
jgi:hypothetical protein